MTVRTSPAAIDGGTIAQRTVQPGTHFVRGCLAFILAAPIGLVPAFVVPLALTDMSSFTGGDGGWEILVLPYVWSFFGLSIPAAAMGALSEGLRIAGWSLRSIALVALALGLVLGICFLAIIAGDAFGTDAFLPVAAACGFGGAAWGLTGALGFGLAARRT